jgi:hypothetical protein
LSSEAAKPRILSVQVWRDAFRAAGHAADGNRNRVTINQLAPNGTGAATAGGTSTAGSGEPESKSWCAMWWVAGMAGIVAAGGTIPGLFLS